MVTTISGRAEPRGSRAEAVLPRRRRTSVPARSRPGSGPGGPFAGETVRGRGRRGRRAPSNLRGVRPCRKTPSDRIQAATPGQRHGALGSLPPSVARRVQRPRAMARGGPARVRIQSLTTVDEGQLRLLRAAPRAASCRRWSRRSGRSRPAPAHGPVSPVAGVTEGVHDARPETRPTDQPSTPEGVPAAGGPGGWCRTRSPVRGQLPEGPPHRGRPVVVHAGGAPPRTARCGRRWVAS